MIEALGFFLIFIMGIVLGMLGIGGAILTTPILIYCFDFTPSIATHYSLLIIGICCSMGARRYHSLYSIKTKIIILFAPTATITAYLTRHWVIPNLPKQILTIGTYTLTNESFILLIFSLTLCTTSLLLLLNNTPKETSETTEHPLFQLIPISILTGFLCGFIGIGGGFIMIPVFTSILNTPIKQAIGTSMAISAIQAFAAFIGGVHAGQTPNLALITTFVILAIGGLLLGAHLSPKLKHHHLKKCFSLFTVTLGLAIFLEEFIITVFVH
jgi:uncharacterized protein